MLLYLCSLTMAQLDTMTMNQFHLLDWCEATDDQRGIRAKYWLVY